MHRVPAKTPFNINKMIKSFWEKSIGAPTVFSLEARIFNAICLTSVVSLIFTVCLNFLLGIQQLVILMVSVLACAVLCYYFARFKGKLISSIIVYMVVINILLAVNFKYNSGINGPTLLIFVLCYFLTISIVPKKQYWFWISLNLLIVLALLSTEYRFPQFIPDTYSDIKSRYIDLGYTYILTVLFVFLVTTYVRQSYFTQHQLVEQKADELEFANETKNKLFSILAHDLRSPLASIQNYLEILSELQLDEDERLSINKKLLNSTQNTQQILSNLLLWSKSQMEGANVNMVNLNLGDVLQSTLQIQHTLAAEKGIQMVDRLKSSVSIIADADMLQLIIRNLISNAIKFTDPGGEIIISSDIIGDDCRITIKDNGTGINYEQQSDIFSLKAKTTYGTKNEKGVGLGLVLCKEFTELQNGKIAFESSPGVGTSFKLAQNINKIDTREKGEFVNES